MLRAMLEDARSPAVPFDAIIQGAVTLHEVPRLQPCLPQTLQQSRLPYHYTDYIHSTGEKYVE